MPPLLPLKQLSKYLEGLLVVRRGGPEETLFRGLSNRERPRILYVDTLREPHAQSNVLGIAQAYARIGRLEAFDYRYLGSQFGPGLMNRMLLQKAKQYQPDLIHLGKSETIKGATVRQVKACTKAKIIHFYGDYRAEPQPWVIDIGQYADWTLLYHKDINLIERHHEKGIKNIGFWWVGVDTSIFKPVQEPKDVDLVFMGSNYDFLPGHADRRSFINNLCSKGFDLHLYGNGWEDFAQFSNVKLHGFVDQQDFVQACSRARIALGVDPVSDVRMYTSWRRPLNTMATGTFYLTRYFSGLEEVFENHRHLVWFRDNEEAVELLNYYLEHDLERERIAQTGRDEVILHHSWDKRINEMLVYFDRVPPVTNWAQLAQ